MKIGIVGAGTMGSGIALVAASAGEAVLLTDLAPAARAAVMPTIKGQLARRREKGAISAEDESAIAARISIVERVSDLSACDAVIEAVVERLDVKQAIFHELGRVLGDGAVLATNTSSLSVTALAASAPSPERVVGLHFFNPAPILPLVEVVQALQTSDETVSRVVDLATRWGKTPIRVKDTPAFVVNRVARPFYLEALRVLEEGIADEATIDHAMRAHGGFRMGPFELMDLIGIDVNAAVTESVFRAFSYDARYRPSLVQQQLVLAGRFGRKSGRGFYRYGENASRPSPKDDEALQRRIVFRIVVMLINEAVDALFWRVASAEEIDRAVLLGVNYPKGLIAWGEEIGWPEVLRHLETLREEYGEERYRPSPLLRRAAKDGLSLLGGSFPGSFSTGE